LCPLLRPSYGHLHHRRPALSHRLGKFASPWDRSYSVCRRKTNIHQMGVFERCNFFACLSDGSGRERWWRIACMDRPECVT
jgi:hypothetical protein